MIQGLNPRSSITHTIINQLISLRAMVNKVDNIEISINSDQIAFKKRHKAVYVRIQLES